MLDLLQTKKTEKSLITVKLAVIYFFKYAKGIYNKRKNKQTWLDGPNSINSVKGQPTGENCTGVNTEI